MSFSRRYFWHLFPCFIGLVLFALLLSTGYASKSMRQYELERIATDLEIKAALVAEKFSTALTRQNAAAVWELAWNTAKTARTHICVLLPDGRIVADSQTRTPSAENDSTCPEIKAALNGQTGRATRLNPALGQNMLYLAYPLEDNARIIGVLRLAVSISEIDKNLHRSMFGIIKGGVLALFCAVLLTLWLSRYVVKPLQVLCHGAEAFAAGKFQYKISSSKVHEFNNLATAMNHMAETLDRRFKTIVNQRNQITAVLSSLDEGVLAISDDGTIIINNSKTSEIFEYPGTNLVGMKYDAVIRNVGFNRFIEHAFAADYRYSADITLHLGREKTVRATSSPLIDASDRILGMLIVLDDVTAIKVLETMRRDFAVNVSHEIRTPLTAIQGFVETLIETGAVDEEGRPFLQIIEKNVNRLNAILNDLVDLSRIEKQGETADIELVRKPLAPVIESAVNDCQLLAAQKQIRLRIVGEKSVQAPISEGLLRRALVNLLENAIRYSDPETEVQARFQANDKAAWIEIADQGPGIAPKYHKRIFERFYRVDTARSRATGGTGLGLALVKHIARIHGGQISLVSALGKGASFRITLPFARKTTA